MDKIAIIGAGLIGRAWAMVFARAGHEVALYDADGKALKANLAVIRRALKDLRAAGIVKEAPERIYRRIRAASSLEDALAGAGYAQENVSETLVAKRKIFAAMDQFARPGTILASSTSTIPASAFTAALKGRARCLVAHPVNPPHLVPLVELCPAPWTSKRVLARARALHESVGQVPITVKKEIQGFILNRLQAAVLNEALSLYADGYASSADIDKTVRDGLGLRWSFMGPFETIDLNAPGGVADYAARYGQVMYEQVCSQAPRRWKKDVIARLARERRSVLPASDLAQRQAWRDRRLMALAVHKREASKKS
jgi:3-hydroxyacyl-CoA dehydrogenase